MLKFCATFCPCTCLQHCGIEADIAGEALDPAAFMLLLLYADRAEEVFLTACITRHQPFQLLLCTLGVHQVLA